MAEAAALSRVPVSFRITARTILELGAELISSDAVAIYELVKNALDAGSPAVSVHVNAVIRHSAYREALDALAARTSTLQVLADLQSHVLGDAPEVSRSRFFNQLRGAVAERATFRRALKRLYREEHWIKVIDTGQGMSFQGLSDDFLTIGTRSRRKKKVSRLGRPLDTGATLLGEKGVGRLSAMRLGDYLSVFTTQAGDDFWSELHIDWNRFSHESDAYLEQIKISPQQGKLKTERRYSGTTIQVSALKGDWDAGVFQQMAKEQFRRIIDPLPETPGTLAAAERPDPEKLFDLRFNGRSQELDGVPTWLLKQAHAVVHARYEFTERGSPSFSGTIDYRLRNKSTSFQYVEAELLSFTDPIADREVRSSPRVLRELGPFEVSFYWYNRRILTELAVESLDEKLARTKLKGLKRGEVVAAVNEWSGGLMVFRNGFRIQPYGSGDDDWLELDKKALAAKGYKVNRAQIIGCVRLSSLNHRLVEQTNREGLADNEYKHVLVGVLRFLMITEFRDFITDIDNKRKVRELTTAEELNERIKNTRDSTERTILELIRSVPQERERLQALRGLTQQLGRLMDQTRQLSEELEEEKANFAHLAGIGLMVEFILHEIGRATGRALEVVTDIDRAKMPDADADALRTLEDQLKTLRKRVDNLDPLSTSRRQTPENFDVGEVVRQTLSGRTAQFERHGIELIVSEEARPWPIKAVRGMLIGILENLIENAVYWLKIERRVSRRFRPRLQVEINRSEHEIRVTDNGPGVATDRSETIFEPFVTAKPAGQGRGLGLYISREMAKPGGWHISMADVEGERPGRRNTFILDLDPSR